MIPQASRSAFRRHDDHPFRSRADQRFRRDSEIIRALRQSGPGAGSSLLLLASIGSVRAFALFALGESISGAEAVALGFPNKMLPQGEVLTAARAGAKTLAQKPAGSVVWTKRLMRDVAALLARIDEERLMFDERLNDEACEALRAFAERGPPKFSKYVVGAFTFWRSWWNHSVSRRSAIVLRGTRAAPRFSATPFSACGFLPSLRSGQIRFTTPISLATSKCQRRVAPTSDWLPPKCCFSGITDRLQRNPQPCRQGFANVAEIGWWSEARTVSCTCPSDRASPET